MEESAEADTEEEEIADLVLPGAKKALEWAAEHGATTAAEDFPEAASGAGAADEAGPESPQTISLTLATPGLTGGGRDTSHRPDPEGNGAVPAEEGDTCELPGKGPRGQKL